MRQRPGTYTRFISATKIVLPLIAIGLLATVFLFTKEQELEGGLRFSAADLAALATGLSISDPKFSGQNAAGDVYDFGAEQLFPDSLSPSHIVAKGLAGEIRYISGEVVELSANSVEFDVDKEILDLTGDITIAVSDGTVATADAMRADLETGIITSEGAVSAQSPLGYIEAGSFRLETIMDGGKENQMIWFENGVKLNFRPKSWNDDKVDSE